MLKEAYKIEWDVALLSINLTSSIYEYHNIQHLGQTRSCSAEKGQIKHLSFDHFMKRVHLVQHSSCYHTQQQPFNLVPCTTQVCISVRQI